VSDDEIGAARARRVKMKSKARAMKRVAIIEPNNGSNGRLLNVSSKDADGQLIPHLCIVRISYPGRQTDSVRGA
jgi:hypothetical protein